ncbi:MAG: DnaJ domain-containing protein [bacterium]|nr:DnaJ domain-containing protein [bacterium]
MANDIKKYPVPLIFKKIFKDTMTGELIVTGDHFKKQLFFIKGELVFGATTMAPERLGEILLSTGKITSSEFIKLTRIKEHTPRKVGEILVDITNLNTHDIFYALLYQVKTIALSTFALTEGEWTFTEKPPKIPGNQKFRIKLPEIITEGVDSIEKVSYYKNRFYYRSPVTTPIPESTGKFLSSDDIKFYIKLTGFANTPVAQVISKLVAPELFFWRKLVLLYLLNVVDFVEFTVDQEQNKNIEEINELYDRLKSDEVDFYQLFGVKDTASEGEIKETYLNYSKKYHPDRIQVAPDSTVKKKATEVFAEINRAFEVLSNREKKRDYDMKGHKEENAPSNASQGNDTRRARELYLKGNVLYKKKQYWQAASILEDAVILDNSKASYFILLGLCQAKSPQTQKYAERNLKKASEMEPWNADPIFALGELYRSSNFVKKADIQFKKALELNMDHTLAGKAVKELEELYLPKKKSLFSFSKKK